MNSARARRPGRTARIAVRSFRPGDGTAASTVMVAAFKTFIPPGHWRTVFAGFAPESLEATSRGDGVAAYVAESGGRIVGYARGTVSPFGFGTLSVIGVDPGHLHQGVGSLLMRRMLAYWRRHRMRKVSTCVSAHNGRAFRFYLSHGFRPVGYQQDHFMVGVDEILLDRFLGPATGSGGRARTHP
jgi:ribosomal protein S18 acetylase RimI-like enzyme